MTRMNPVIASRVSLTKYQTLDFIINGSDYLPLQPYVHFASSMHNHMQPPHIYQWKCLGLRNNNIHMKRSMMKEPTSAYQMLAQDGKQLPSDSFVSLPLSLFAILLGLRPDQVQKFESLMVMCTQPALLQKALPL
jgi:hypothetical protein